MDMLGARPIRSGSLELLRLPGIYVILQKGEPAGPSVGSSINHIGLLIKDHDEIKRKVNAANLEIASDNYKAADCAAAPGTPACQFHAIFPDGVRVEFTEDKTLNTVAASHHIHMQATDRESIRAWYATTLGATAGMRRGTIFAAMFNGGEVDFNPANQPQLPTKGRAIDHIGFEVKGLEAFCKKLQASGVTFEIPCHVVAETGLKSAFLTDPIGTRIQLTEGLAALNPSVVVDKFAAKGGDIEVMPIANSSASLQIEHSGKVIHFDPITNGDYSTTKAADLILITGMEGDHFDTKAIAKWSKSSTAVVIPPALWNQFPSGIVLASGQTKTVGGINIEAVAAYDLLPGVDFRLGRNQNVDQRPKGINNGYILTLGDKRIYVSGVTECVPEVQELKSIDVAFISVGLWNGKMNAIASAVCVGLFKPKVVYPYHHRTGSYQEFKDALAGKFGEHYQFAVDVRLRPEWMPKEMKSEPVFRR
ncbi:MAG: MBL fold metallo-hydrolase [Acidobacteria bacterium]|nr:MBL fold metallo-hydrolase [Acidobacteriota bacterium]